MPRLETVKNSNVFSWGEAYFELCSERPLGLMPSISKPNILLILADDLGYGDVRCYNDQSKVATPHLDRLAREGMRFTDAHSPATVCRSRQFSITVRIL